MFIRKIIAIAALGVAAALPLPASAAPSAPNTCCILTEHRATLVAPYWKEERLGHTTFRTLQGARILLPAERGVTPKWLRRELGRYFDDMKRGAIAPDCVFAVQQVRAEVDPGGTGCYVNVIAKNKKGAEEVLRRARLLLR